MHEILYEGNPLKMVKTYGSNKCILCIEERLEIFKELCRNKKKLINKRHKFIPHTTTTYIFTTIVRKLKS